ncbi:MAG: PAS domain S-box protein, partial [Rhodospirillaceae bacterium]
IAALRDEVALAESERLHKAMLDTAVDAIVTIDARGIIQRVNPATTRMFGYAAGELNGANVSVLMPESDSRRHDGYLRSYGETGRAKIIGSSRELMARRRDGSMFPIELTLSQIDLPGQRMFTGILRDVSRRAEAERRLRVSENRLQRSQAYANIGTWEWNIETGELYWSDRIPALFGYGPGELETSYENFLAAVHPDDRDAVVTAVEACIAGKAPYDMEHRIVWPNGTVRWLLERGDVERDSDGRPNRMLGVVQDITRMKDADFDLRAAQREAQKANRAKSEFLSSMSHELRTPLNAILGFAQLLDTDRNPPLSDRQLDRVRHIRKGGNHLLTLINEVLDLARIEAGKLTMSLEDFIPDILLDESLSMAATIAAGRGILVVDGRSATLPAVKADYTRLKQVLINLLSNAVKYNRDGGTVTVTTVALDGALRVVVADTGHGIPSGRLPELFEPFNRLGAEATDVEGTGIGLTLTRTLIEGMGGSIGVSSTPGVGSTFWVDIPMAAHQPEPQQAPEDVAPPALPVPVGVGEQSHLVLYVEDNPANLRLMEDICIDLPDISLISAHNAELGLDIARHHQPALILMDINLPGMDGLQAVARLRDDPRTAHIPVIALSANAMQAAVRRAREAGFVAYLTKPVVIEDLRAAIWSALNGSAES